MRPPAQTAGSLAATQPLGREASRLALPAGSTQSPGRGCTHSHHRPPLATLPECEWCWNLLSDALYLWAGNTSWTKCLPSGHFRSSTDCEQLEGRTHLCSSPSPKHSAWRRAEHNTRVWHELAGIITHEENTEEATQGGGKGLQKLDVVRAGWGRTEGLLGPRKMG